jgi:leader peptidase (prepilin peptidase)/N-methyltransferase
MSIHALPTGGGAAAPAPMSAGRLHDPLPATLVAAAAVIVASATFAVLPFDRALVAGPFAAVLVVLAAIDLERRIIPNRIVLPAAATVLVAQIALFPGQGFEYLLAALLTALVMMIPQLIGRNWMGMGDVKLALLLGAALGWAVLGALFIAFLCVFPVAVALLIRYGGTARKMTIPFGPFLCLGALIVLFGAHIAGLPTS